jgi:CheY-like chemotaxis protein
LRLYQRCLRGRFEVVPAGSGRAALELIDSGELFDAVLCDVHMDDMSGYDLFELVRRRFPQQARRFVWVSGSGAPAPVVEPGQQQQLQKPFTLDELETAIVGVLSAASVEAVQL